VRAQERFFHDGVIALKELTMREIADKASLHESTVSRVARGKQLYCEQGMFELRYFFGSGIGSPEKQAGPAARAVQYHIRHLIAAEPPAKPLSDDRIVAELAANGIEIARRTVAKYRESMNIPSSVIRRKRNARLAAHP